MNGVSKPARWEVILFSERRIDRQEVLANSTGFVWDGLDPGLKFLHVLPTSPDEGLTSFLLPFVLEPGKSREVVAPIIVGSSVDGEVVDSKGNTLPYAHVQAVLLPIGLNPVTRKDLAHDLLFEQAQKDTFFLPASYSDKFDRWGAMRVIGRDRLFLGRFTGIQGEFTIKGLPLNWVRVQVSNGKELLYDRIVFPDGKRVRLQVSSQEIRPDANAYVGSYLLGMGMGTFEEEVLRMTEEYPSDKAKLIEAIMTDISSDLCVDQKTGLSRTLSQLRAKK